MFTDEEVDYLESQHLARLGTVDSDGQVDVSPVGFEFDGEAFYVSSFKMDMSHKGVNVADGNRLVSLVVDDLASTDPWLPRGIKIHGVADFVERDTPTSMARGDRHIRIRPVRSWSFGILAAAFQHGKWTPTKRTWPTTGLIKPHEAARPDQCASRTSAGASHRRSESSRR